MNNFYDTYNIIKDFAGKHEMINEFVLVRNEDEMNNLEFNYRTMILAPVEANITRQLNNPVYSLDFVVVILDRVSMNSDIDSVMSIEENIFVLGQLQDYLIQIGHDVEFDSIDLYSSMMDDYNVTSATASFTINIARKPYINGLNIN